MAERFEFRYQVGNRRKTTPVRAFVTRLDAVNAAGDLARRVGLVDIYHVRRSGAFMLATVSRSGRVSHV